VKNVNRCPLTCEHGVVDTSISSGSGGHLFNAIVQPDQIQVRFDGERLVADAGLLLPATLAVGLGRRELVDELVDLGDTPGRANAGDKAMTLVASALAGAAGSTTATGCAPGRPGRSWATGSSPIHDRQVPALVHLGPRPASWTGSPPRRWGGPGPGPGRGRTPSLWTPRSGRSMGWPSRAPPSATPRSAATTRCWGSAPAPATCSMPGCAAATPTPRGGGRLHHRDDQPGPCRRRHRAAYPAGRLGLLRHQVVKVCQQAGCAPRSPPSATRGPQGDPADPRRRLGADRLLAGGRAAVAETSYRPFGKRGPAVRLIVRRVRPTRARSWRWT